MLQTERYQPTRTWALAAVDSTCTLGTSHAMSEAPIWNSNPTPAPGSGPNSAMMDGNADRCSHAVTLPPCVEPAFHVLRGDGVVVAVMNLVVARPDHLHRRADVLRQQRRFDDEVGLRLAAEPAADERHVQRDLRQVDPQRGGHFLARRLRVLRRRPDLARAVLHAGQRRGRFHGRVRQMGDVVVGAHARGRRSQRRGDVALRADGACPAPSTRLQARRDTPWSRTSR